MTDPHTPGQTPPRSDSDRWAPWWVYLVVLLGANYLRAFLMADVPLPPPATAAIALGQAGLLFIVVTAVWRMTRATSP